MRLFFVLVLLALFAVHAAADTTITYQGQLQDNGQPFNGQADMSFELFDDFDPNDPSVGTSVAGPISVNDVDVSDGLFQVDLDFGAVYEQPVWIEITVGTDTLHPRQRLTSTPVAVHALNVSSTAGAWMLGGNAGTNPADDFLGTTDTSPLELRVNNEQSLLINPVSYNDPSGVTVSGTNFIAGYVDNSAESDAVGATIGGGGGNIDGTAYSNTVAALAHFSTIGGGLDNKSSGLYSTIGGGTSNHADDNWITIGGGTNHIASERHTTIGGGSHNSAEAATATVAGGGSNTASGLASSVPGGTNNVAAGRNSFAAGQQANALHDGSFVWADYIDSGFESTGENQFLIRANGGVGINHNSPTQSLDVSGNVKVSGWLGTDQEEPVKLSSNAATVLEISPLKTDISTQGHNLISGYSENYVENGTIGANLFGGGIEGTTERPNAVHAHFGVISGGFGNQAGTDDGDPTSGIAATVSGGIVNRAFAGRSTVAGGAFNLADGLGATVGGGSRNWATAARSTVPGGYRNRAGGQDSFAAGRRARVLENHDGTFVWADSDDTNFESTGPDQFLIMANGGVGIGTNSPRNQLDVVRNKSGSSANANHVMVVDNTATSQGNVLGLRTNATTPGAAENFITFKAASSNVGAIEGDGAGGITLTSGSADFAEYLRIADGAADIRPADVVGVVGDTVSLRTGLADRAMVVSTRPIMTGNDPGLEAGERDGHVPVAFLGQVPVRVSGPVNAGDYVVPSGLDDGTGIGVPPDELSADQLPQVVGRALEDTESESNGLVRALVGLPHTAIMASVTEQRDLRLEQLESRVTEQGQQLIGLHEVNAELHHELDRMASRNAELRETVRSLVEAREQSRELKRRIAKLEALLLEQSKLAGH